jgi:hypothetical protein
MTSLDQYIKYLEESLESAKETRDAMNGYFEGGAFTVVSPPITDGRRMAVRDRKKSRVSTIESAILQAVENREPFKASELAKRLDIGGTSMASCIYRLKLKGIIERIGVGLYQLVQTNGQPETGEPPNVREEKCPG